MHADCAHVGINARALFSDIDICARTHRCGGVGGFFIPIEPSLIGWTGVLTARVMCTDS